VSCSHQEAGAEGRLLIIMSREICIYRVLIAVFVTDKIAGRKSSIYLKSTRLVRSKLDKEE
jgi:hypothetical protein